MAKVLMCEANVSEGRRPEVVEELVATLRASDGVRVADWSSDADHHRSVLTFLGEPDAVERAAERLAEVALARIDMRTHRGAHPRMGALDVIPFIPIRGVETAEAVETARHFGRFLGGRGVPVYYYEDAATRPERQSLPDIRKGEYEGLAAKLADPAWKPDEGPAEFNPQAGATVTGVRFPLIAFNVNLRTTDVGIAQAIARSVRHISGGYRHVRGMGFSLEERGMVQVSMNLTNYRKTPIHRVLETVRSEAARHGVTVAGTEIIGPIPLAALEEVVQHYLQAHDFAVEQVVETALLG